MALERDWWKKALAEMLGAFALVVVGAGSVLVAASNLALGEGFATVLLYAALAHGLVIAVMGTALGPISGGQISPAVTLGLMATGRVKKDLGLLIILAQLVGSVFGGLLLRWLYGLAPGTPGGSLHLATPSLAPGLQPIHGIILEMVMTFVLVFVVFATAIDPRGVGKTMGAFPIGFAVGAMWLFGGGLTAAAMSPGRWLGPAVASGFFDNWYVYWIGPLLGGLLAAVGYEFLFMPAKKK